MKGQNIIITSGKRKTAIAKAVTTKGKGIITINGYPVELYPVDILKEKIMEPTLNYMGPLRFELKLPTPQAGRIPNYPTVPLREW